MWITLAITAIVFLALMRNWAPPDVLFVGGVALLALVGVITPEEALRGFSNPGVLTIAALFVVAAGLRETGILDYLSRQVLGHETTELGAFRKLVVLVLPLSAFLNNTPVVAMMVPMVIDWCRRHRISPSRLLIPLSYLAILGGTCTLIGTSTNLVVHGLMVVEHEKLSAAAGADETPQETRFREGVRGLGMFEIALAGLPYAVLGSLYLHGIGIRLLPKRQELLEQLGESRREYLVEMIVQPGCRLIGQSVMAAGLRQLPGLFLIEIDRDGRRISPVSPEEVLLVEDRLVFTGVVSSIVELERIEGLVPAADPNYEVRARRQMGQLCEAVVSSSSPLVGKSIRDADFRATYNAAVVAVHRNGERMTNKVGDVELLPGDTLLLQTPPHFNRAHRNNTDFYLVSDVKEWRPLRRDRAWIALATFALLVLLMTTGWIANTAIAAFLAATVMIVSGCISSGDARRSMEWQVLITIAAAFGLGAALDQSGAARAVATLLVDSVHLWGPLAVLAVFYLLGSAMTEMITNNAAAVLLFPFCIETARLMEVSPRPFLIALILAASASFITPIGYQTNMMVYGPGGYRAGDFVRIGLPLNLLLWATAMVLIPFFWPFT